MDRKPFFFNFLFIGDRKFPDGLQKCEKCDTISKKRVVSLQEQRGSTAQVELKMNQKSWAFIRWAVKSKSK